MVKNFQLETTQIKFYRVLVLSGLVLSRSVNHQGLLMVICIRYFVVSNLPAVRPTYFLGPMSKIFQNYVMKTF